MRIITWSNLMDDYLLISYLGNVGEETGLTDSLGTSLKVGDIVYYINGRLDVAEESFVVKEEDVRCKSSKDPFVMGIDGVKFGKINGCSFEEFFNIDKTNYSLQEIIEMDDNESFEILAANRNPNLERDKWYVVKAFDALDLPGACSVKGFPKLSIHEIEDSEFYDMLEDARRRFERY